MNNEICKNCQAADILADSIVEKNKLKQEIEEQKTRIELLEKGLIEYADRITNGEIGKLKAQIYRIKTLLWSTYKVLHKNKRGATKEAVEIIERHIYMFPMDDITNRAVAEEENTESKVKDE
jgi:hypothetical protein